MKRTLIALSMVLCQLSGLSWAGETVTIATGEWAPYVSERLEDNGFTAEVVREAFQRAGVAVAFSFDTWRASENQVRTGSVLASFPHKRTEEREAFAYFSEPIGESRGVFFFMKPNFPGGRFEFRSFADLKGYRVAAVKGYWYNNLFQRAGVNVVEMEPDVKVLIEHLRWNFIDFFPENELVGWAWIESLFPMEMDRFGSTRNAYSKGYLHLMVSRDHPRGEYFLRAFNNGLQSLIESGEYDKIHAKHNRAFHAMKKTPDVFRAKPRPVR